MTVSFKVHPEFCRRDTDKGVVQTLISPWSHYRSLPGTPCTTLMKLQYEEFKIVCNTGKHLHSDLNDCEPGTCTQCSFLFVYYESIKLNTVGSKTVEKIII